MKLNSNVEYIIKTQKELDYLLVEWQERLMLQSWNVRAYICKKEDMADNTEGTCSYKNVVKSAYISILRHKDFNGRGAFKQDMEVALVHELLHLHYAPYFNDEDETEMEQTIDLLAKVFVDLKRNKGIEDSV